MALGFGDNVARLSATLELDDDGFMKGMAEASAKLDAYNAKLKEEGVGRRFATMASRDYAKQLYNEARAVDQAHQSHGRLLQDMDNLKQRLKDFNGTGPYGLTSLTRGIARVTAFGISMGQAFDRGARFVGDWIEGVTKGIPILESLGAGLSGVLGFLGQMVAVLGPVGVGVAAVAGAFGLLQGVLIGILNIAGGVVAFFADLVAPIGLVAGLLGGLAGAFVLGGKRAAEGGGKLQGFADKLATLRSMFGHTTRELAGDFLPVLMRLADDAQHALLFVDKLAHMPLAEAMKTAARQGIPALENFINQIGHLVAKPIRLAFQIAFGRTQAGNEMSTAVSNLWTQFEHFWLGYTRTRTLRFGNGRVLQITEQQANGALQPFLNWFSRHDFSAQGVKIAHGIEHALDRAGVWKNVGKFIGNSIDAGISQAMKGMASRILQALIPKFDTSGLAKVNHTFVQLFGGAFDWLKSKASAAWSSVARFASNSAGAAKRDIESLIGSGLSWIIGKAQSIWNTVEGIFSAPFHIHFSIPSVHIPGTGITLASGGVVTGGVPNKDSVPAMLMPGEVVLSKDAVAKLGGPYAADALNMAGGGLVPPPRHRKEKRDHYRTRLSTWLGNTVTARFDALDFQLQLADRIAQRDDQEGRIPAELTQLAREQKIRHEEIALYGKARRVAHRFGFLGQERQYAQAATMLKQDVLDAALQIKNLKGTSAQASAQQIASFLSEQQSFLSEFAGNIILPGAAAVLSGSTSATAAAASSGGGKLPNRTLKPGGGVTIHNHFTQTPPDSFVHIRKAALQAAAVFG